jgi:tetratricopeptide (TPR) repeat protein
MTSSIVDKYQQIFAADPRSRIFVELAKALLERGDPARAIAVCRTGLEHHPSSILGRVVWGRSLLAQDDLAGAQDQFEIAIALDPGSPYAYNLVGEALFQQSRFREALPVLARAVELQPADARLRGWLEEARRAAQAAGRAPALAPPGASAGEPGERTRPFHLPEPPVASGPAAPPAAGAPRALGGEPGAELARVGDAPAAAPGPQPAHPATAPATPPPARTTPPPLSPALYRDEVPRSLLAMIPGATRPSTAAMPAAAAPQLDDAEAEELTARFEQEVRERLLAEPEPPPTFHRRHRAAILGGILALAAACAVALFLHLRASNRSQEAAGAAVRARAGLARDTVGALHEAARLLALARASAPTPELTSLSAQVAAVLAVEHDDEGARALATDLAARADAGDGGRAAAYLLAGSPSKLASAEAAILAAPPSSEPFVQALAGRILVGRGELEAGRGRLEIAARASPPLLRALSDLGDAAQAAGDLEGALGFYGAALSAVPTHPRSVVGAAEARLALGLDLPRARADLEAMAADPGSAPPRDLRVRFEVACARVLVALGEPAAAAARLARTAEQLGESAALASAAAEAHLATRSYERAEASAARAVALEPGDAAARALLARARTGRGRYAEALAATGSAEGRAIFLQRAIARFHLGQTAEARRELERTAHDGRMPAEAAVWYALTDLRLGRAEQARALLEKLAAARTAPPLASVALGQALEALGRSEDAETAYRAALARDPSAPEGHAALGRLLLGRGSTADAVPELQKAVAADPADLEARRALGSARLATGQPALARAELDAVLQAHPSDLEALRLLSAAWLAEGQPREARRAADRGLAREPASPALLVAAARAARAQGDHAVARKLADRAVKLAGRGPDAAEARVLQAELRKR